MKTWGRNLLFALLVGPLATGAEEVGKPIPSARMYIGLTATEGNRNTALLNVSIVGEHERKGFGAIRGGLETNYGTAKSEETTESGEPRRKSLTTADNGRLFFNTKKTISPKLFWVADVAAGYDRVAKTDYRVAAVPGFGAYLILRDSVRLAADGGLGYVWEKSDEKTDRYPVGRVSERLEYQLNAAARLWQTFEYVPRTADLSDYQMASELGVETALNRRLSLRWVIQNRYDSTPPTGLKRNDFTLISALAVSL